MAQRPISGRNTGPLLKIPGWYLSYPSGQVVQLKVTLTGKIPADTSSSQDLLMIEEIDAETSVRSTARIAMPEAPLLTLSTPTKIPVTKKVFTPIPTATTTTQESPLGFEAGLIAAALVVLVKIRKD